MISRPALALLLLLAACTPEDAEKLDAYEISTDASATVPTVVEASWDSQRAGSTWVEYGLDGAFDQQTPSEPATGGEEHVELRGLKAGRTYELRAVTETADGERLVSEVSTLEVEPPPLEISRFTAMSRDEGVGGSAAFLLTTLIQPDRSWIAILDHDGDLVWSWELDEGVVASEARFLPDSDSVAWLQYDVNQITDLGTIVRVSFDGSQEVRTRALRGHHSFVALPGDRYAWLSFDARLMEIEGELVWVTADTILEVEEGADDSVEPREIFSFFEDYSSIFVTCDHFWEAPPYAEGGAEFSHANSLVYDEATDRFWVMNRNLDNLMEIERGDGAIVTEIGGVQGLTTESSRDMWSHGHFSQIWEGGFTVFDNGYHHDLQVSRVNEYAFDRESGALSLVWTTFAGNGQFLEMLGDVDRLEDTHVVSWTESGMITEIDDAGELIWRLEAEIGTAIGRLTPTESLYDLGAGEP